jgi:hypothetical protein
LDGNIELAQMVGRDGKRADKMKVNLMEELQEELFHEATFV